MYIRSIRTLYLVLVLFFTQHAHTPAWAKGRAFRNILQKGKVRVNQALSRGRAISSYGRARYHRFRAWNLERKARRNVNRAVNTLEKNGIVLSAPVVWYTKHYALEASSLESSAMRLLHKGKSKSRLLKKISKRIRLLERKRYREVEHAAAKAKSTNGVIAGGATIEKGKSEIVINLDAPHWRNRSELVKTLVHENQHIKDWKQYIRLERKSNSNNRKRTVSQISGTRRLQLKRKAQQVIDPSRMETRAFAETAYMSGISGAAFDYSFLSAKELPPHYAAKKINHALISNYFKGFEKRLKPAMKRASPQQRKLVKAYLAGYRKELTKRAKKTISKISEPPLPLTTLMRLGQELQSMKADVVHDARRIKFSVDLKTRHIESPKQAYEIGRKDAAHVAASPNSRVMKMLSN